MADDRTRDVEKKHALAVGMQRLERAAQPDPVVDIAFRLGWIGKGCVLSNFCGPFRRFF